MIRLLAVLLLAGVGSAWWRLAVVYVRPDVATPIVAPPPAPSITLGMLTARTVTLGSIAAGTITGATLRAGAARMELDARGMRTYNDGGTVTFRLDVPPEPIRPFGILAGEPWRVRAWHRVASAYHAARWRLHDRLFPDCGGSG